MKHHNLATALFGLGLGLASQAHAGNCTALIGDLMNWAKSAPASIERKIGVTMTSNVNTRKFAGYSTATLDYYPGFVSGLFLVPERLAGEGKTYFSDRTWNYVTPGCTGFCGSAEPFNPAKTDKVRITLRKNLANPASAFVTLTLLSWGNAQLSFPAQCDNGHIYGFKADQHGTHLFDLTFNKTQFAIPH
jgi:hypothetical protein